MAWRDCWYCEVRSHQTMHGEPHRREIDARRSVWMVAYRCDECDTLSLASITLSANHKAPSQVKPELDKREANLDWHPPTALGRRYPDVPEHIADAASEAHACHSIRSFRAAVLMARSVIEATAKDHGITSGVLRDKIDEMRKQELVRELVSHQAHEIRYLGNEMAHGDFVDPITEEESAEVLGLMGEVLAEVYQAPAKLKALQNARLAKKAASSPP